MQFLHNLIRLYSRRGSLYLNLVDVFVFYRKAADQGHPHASYNLAVGHLKGYKTDVKEGLVVILFCSNMYLGFLK